MLRAVICDDEDLSIERLSCLLPRACDISIVGTARDGLSALEQITQTKPDLVLLDIEMPGLDGFDVVEHLAWERIAAPLIVFVSAFPNFAAQAFEAGAIDFLTKPVRRPRIEAMIERVVRARAERSAMSRLEVLATQMEALRQSYEEQTGSGNYLWVRCRDGRIRLDLDDVERVEAEGEYVRLHYGAISYLHRESITAMEERLDPRRFLRIHRSRIIRRIDVVHVARKATGSYVVTTPGGREFAVGKSYRHAVRSLTSTSLSLAPRH